MFSIWWIGLFAAAVMVVFGLLHFPPYKRHPEWLGERRDFAAKTFYRLVWQEGLLFAALCFMLMRSTVRMNTTGQTVILGILLVVMAAAILLLDIPVTNAVKEKFGEEE